MNERIYELDGQKNKAKQKEEELSEMKYDVNETTLSRNDVEQENKNKKAHTMILKE